MYIQDNYLILEQRDVWKPKKITGTTMGEMLGLNKFKKKGDAILTMIRAYKEEIDPFYTNRGAIAEHVLRAKCIDKGYEIKYWDAKEVNWDNFSNINKDFGGLIDLVSLKPTRQLFECKSKNISKLAETKKYPNLSYECQAKLYGYLSKCDDINLVYVFFTDEQEQAIKEDKVMDLTTTNFVFYGYKVHLDREEFSKDMQKCLDYKNKCLNEMRIPLEDISEKTLQYLKDQNRLK